MAAFVAGQTNHIALLNQLASRNALINSGFVVNQRGYVSGAVLAAGNYGHDRWKAGASGGDYTFSGAGPAVTITIASGKSLIQIMEPIFVEGGQYVLSWSGTAQARAGINTSSPSGSYASSPIVIPGQSAGVGMAVEFNTGTLLKPKLEVATADPTDWQVLPLTFEQLLCQRYLPAFSSALGTGERCNGFAITTSQSVIVVPFRVPPRIPPTGITVLSAPSDISIYSWKTNLQGAATAAAFQTAGLLTGNVTVTTVAGTPTLAVGDPVMLLPANTNLNILFTGCEL